MGVVFDCVFGLNTIAPDAPWFIQENDGKKEVELLSSPFRKSCSIWKTIAYTEIVHNFCFACSTHEPHHEKRNILHMRKQYHRSASQ